MKISIELEPQMAEQLAQFCKRCSHDTFMPFTEAHLPANERTERAYQMMFGIDAVGNALRDEGYAQR